MNSREAAYTAILKFLQEGDYIEDSLGAWRKEENPSSQDFGLAQEIAFGSVRRTLSLDFLALQLSSQRRLKLKLKEKVFLRIALYQYFFMNRIPLYAIANETIKIAQKHCHRNFLNYLNAILRSLPETTIVLPQTDSLEDLSIRYSYPIFFIENLISSYGLKTAKEIMDAGNRPSLTMARIRPTTGIKQTKLNDGLKVIVQEPSQVAIVENNSLIEELSHSSEYYIQNVTPAVLISLLSTKHSGIPAKILDLCASPGGKAIAVHDFFPQARLYANDVSQEKLKRLAENFAKYNILVQLSCSRGESFSTSDKFDIIILDVPCSNTGVLNKRPEARWRLSLDKLKELESLQLQLIQNAKTLLAPQGEIWFMTCSILPSENENLIKKACDLFQLNNSFQKVVLPNNEGWDGGFACLLTKSN